ncbi:monocarboxylate transporter 2 isoform X1 [Glossina fuscipes]|nr:monocarboxylate transporter 2 isoform X1 [Glossina fuscipes]
MVRETSTIMLGNYFKKRRLFVEMVAMSGEGVGIALFSVLLREGVGKVGWRSGLQIIAALCSISFFVGLLYRPASLYHPQRRAIQHLKNQRKKMRDNKTSSAPLEPNIFKKIFQDISNLKSGTIKILLLTSAVAALGIYTPMFTMVGIKQELNTNKDDGKFQDSNKVNDSSEAQELVLMQTILGMSTTLGVVLAGALIRRPFVIRNFTLSTSIVAQFFIASVALSILFMSFVMGYRSLCILSGLYGVGFGGFRFSFKMLALERIKMKFSKTWGFLRGIEAVPVLVSVPLTIFLNDYSLKYGRAGYYICSAAAAIAAIIIFFINHSNYVQNAPKRTQENGIIPQRMRSMSTQHVRTKYRPAFTVDYSKTNGCDYVMPDFLNRSCVSLNQVMEGGAGGSCLYGTPILRNQCHHHLMPFQYNQQLYNPACLSTHADDAASHRYPYHYDTGAGQYLRRSLSFIQNANCCGSTQLQCHCQANLQWSQRDLRMDATTQPLLCTCSPSLYLQNCKSQSVPEGLSTIAQQCKCRTQPSREIVYIPRAPSQSRFCPCYHCHQHRTNTKSNFMRKDAITSVATNNAPSTMPRCKLKRSQSLSRPLQFVEQMTTSV